MAFSIDSKQSCRSHQTPWAPNTLLVLGLFSTKPGHSLHWAHEAISSNAVRQVKKSALASLQATGGTWGEFMTTWVSITDKGQRRSVALKTERWREGASAVCLLLRNNHYLFGFHLGSKPVYTCSASYKKWPKYLPNSGLATFLQQAPLSHAEPEVEGFTIWLSLTNN